MAVVNGNYVKRGRNERATAKANIYYIQTRPGRDKERLSRTLFGHADNMGRREAYQFINDAPKGTYFYRLKLSPDPKREDTKRDLHMQKLTRHLMKRLEKRLNTGLPWAGALHDDHTDIRHVHILAAIPRRLQKYDLEFLIREATQLALVQRRIRDRGQSQLPWQQPSQHALKSGKYTAYRKQSAQQSRVSEASPPQSTCTCPRCHMPQSHNKHQGSHMCLACGRMLHTKKERTLMLQQQKGKGRGLERSL
jgi:hypothetical protein